MRVLSVFAVAATGVAASEPNARLGEQIGNAISAGVSSGEVAAFQAAFQHSVMANQPVVVNDAVSAAVSAANSRAAKAQAAAVAASAASRDAAIGAGAASVGGSGFALRSCAKDYSVCPAGWSASGNFCSAGAGYSGPCPYGIDFSSFDAQQKTAFESKCEVNFPCATSFLAAKADSPTVNLHVESGSVGGIAASELRAARSSLAELEDEEARFKELYANALLRQNVRSEGLQGAAGTRGASFLAQGPVRSAVENAAELASDVQREAKQMTALRSQMNYAIAQIKAGGYTARRAMGRLTNLFAEPNAKLAAIARPDLLTALREHMEGESTPDQSRIAAGSLITQITGLPVSSSSTDVRSGSYGHVNVVMPSPDRVYASDAEIAQLRAGARAADTSEGDYSF